MESPASALFHIRIIFVEYAFNACLDAFSCVSSATFFTLGGHGWFPSGAVCITCQHFRYEVGRRCVTVLTCPIQRGLILQGEHLTKRGAQWVARREVALGWCPEAG
jgi:hypothetical protein